jgi:hypothetical protein
MKYILTRSTTVNPNYVQQGSSDPNMHCTELFHFHDVSVYEMSDLMYTTLQSGWDQRVVTLSYNVAYYGATFFSEIRTVGKLLEPAVGIYTQPVKIPIEITDEIIAWIVEFMQAVGIESMNQEFNRRFKAFQGVSEVEKESWEIQKHEAREWIQYGEDPAHRTPFLDYLAVEQSLDKTVLAEKILLKAEQYADRLSDMLVVYKKLVKELKACTSVWDCNIFNEKYLGYYMPDTQAVQIPGWTISETDSTRVNEVKVHEFNF